MIPMNFLRHVTVFVADTALQYRVEKISGVAIEIKRGVKVYFWL